MLVLSRKQGERIMIGNNITITVVEAGGNRIKLGFDCPAAIPVHREEIHRRLLAADPITAATGKTDQSSYYAEFT